MNIKELAEQAGYLPDMFGIGHWDMPECKRFAELVAAAERERIINIIENYQIHVGGSSAGEVACEMTYMALRDIRDEIRARENPQRPVKSYTNGEPQYATDDMSTKSQNVNTSEERVHESDKSIHDDDDIQEYKKPWVGLTDEEIENFDLPDKPTIKEFVRFIEAALRSKNNG